MSFLTAVELEPATTLDLFSGLVVCGRAFYGLKPLGVFLTIFELFLTFLTTDCSSFLGFLVTFYLMGVTSMT